MKLQMIDSASVRKILYLTEDKGKAKTHDGDSDDEDDEEEDEDDAGTAAEEKWGKGGINRPVMKTNKKYSLCPLHIAIEGGHLVCKVVTVVEFNFFATHYFIIKRKI